MQQNILCAEVQKEIGWWKSPVEDSGSSCRWKICTGGARFPLLNGCEKAGATSGSAWRWESGVRVGAPGAPGSGKGTGGGGRGAGCCGRIGCRGGTAAVTDHALLHGIGARGVGDGRFSFVTFLRDFLSAHFILGQACWEGEGELATCRHYADCGQENWVKCTPP